MYKYLFIFGLLMVQTSQAQPKAASPDSISGKVIYSQKLRLTNTVFASDTLKFNRTKSIFYWNLFNSPEDAAQELKKMVPSMNKVDLKYYLTGQVTYFDSEKDSLFSRMSRRLLHTVLYLKEKKPAIKWSMLDSTKEIGNYTVRKAMASFRGREYTAWFTPDIPLPYGPWKLNGLPGLILQAYDSSNSIYFSATNIVLSQIDTIGPIHLDGKEQIITLTQYKKIMNHFKSRMKSAEIKNERSYLTKEEMVSLPPLQLPDIQLMETFKDSTDE